MTSNSMNLFSLAGKRVLVTGASSGLGRHFAFSLGLAGAELVLAARRRDLLDELARELAATGVKSSSFELDVTHEKSVNELFKGISAAGLQIDVLVNNAGTTAVSSFLDMSKEDWDRVIKTNLDGCFLVAQACAIQMRTAGTGGSIINIASIAGLRQAGHVSAYSASKAAVVQLTKSMALELARFGIRVNAVAPGYIVTDLNRQFLASDAGQALVRRIPQRRLGTPSDLDGAMILLSSDASRYMTGSVVVVDGGHLVTSL